MKTLNKLLQRQIQKYCSKEEHVPEKCMKLFRVISESYDHYEKDRKMLERSIELSSDEMIELNNKLRKEAAELSKAHKDLKTLLENIEDVFFSFDWVEKKVLFISPTCEKIYGYDAAAFYQQPGLWFDVVAEQDKDVILNSFPVLDTGRSSQVEYRIIRKDGTYRWLQAKIKPTVDDTGKVQRLDGIVSDITDRKQAEEKLEKSEKKFRALVEYGTDVVSMVDKDANVFYVSPTYEKQFGFTPEECIGKKGAEFIHPDDLPALERTLDEMMQNPYKPYSIVQRVKNKQGEYLWCEGVAINLLEVKGVNAIVSNFRNITERKEATEVLELTLSRFRQAQEIARLGHWEVDLRTWESTWSDEAFRIHGLDPGTTKPSYEMFLAHVHPDDMDMVKTITGQSMQTFEPFSFHYRMIDAKGICKHLMAIGRYEFDKSGTALRLFGIELDLTELKEKEEKLQHAEANLRNLLENTDTAYVLLDKYANILTFNNLANELSQKQTGDKLVEGNNYISVLPEYRRQEVYNIIEKILDDKKRVTYELNVSLAGDPGQWLQVSMHPIFNEEHKILGLSVAAVNITERKNTEQQIRASNERYELVTKATNDVIWDWDIVNNKVFRSANYEQVFGYTEKEGDIYGASWMNCIHEEDRDRVLDNLLDKIKSPDTILWEDEYRYNRKNGEQAYVHDRGYIIYNEEKEPIRMVGAMRDVTWEKRLALEQEKITAELLRRNNDLEQFAYIISHNLRAPVTNILGIANLLREVNVSPEERKKCMDGLLLSVKKLDEVIIDLNHILQVRREITEKRETVRFSDVVENVKISISNLIQKENAIIFTEFDGVDEIVTLKSYLNSIFYNLILNSIKYRMPDSCPIIRITGRKEEGKIFLSFKDNGLGIDLDAQGNKIFGLYKKFHFHTEGKGMGLYMVKTQVETLGGKISVKSKLNHGTEFLVELEAQ